MGTFCNLIQFVPHSEGWPLIPIDTINHLTESGKAGRFVHYCENSFPQWDVLCAFEDALVENDAHKDWVFVVGSMDDDPEVRGWLEYEDWIFVPLGPEGKRSGSDVGVWSREDFDELDIIIHAFAPATDDSAIHLNKIVRALYGGAIRPDGSIPPPPI
jgi:hypothetical protein